MSCENDSRITASRNFDNSGSFGIWRRLRRIDRVALSFAVLSGVIGLTLPDQFVDSLGFVGQSLLETGPFLAASVLIAAYVKATGADSLIGAAFRAHAGKAVLIAAAVGALSPFCSCGVVPLIAALLGAGVPLAPVMGFWLASPVIDPEMMILTAGVLGVEFAVAKTLSAILIGAVGGYITLAVQKSGGFAQPLRDIAVSTCGTDAVVGDAARPNWRFWTEKPRTEAFKGEVGRTGWFLLKWLSIAFLLEAVMLNNIPMDQVGNWLTHMGAWTIPVSAFVGVPAYLNGYAAIPLADMLMEMGLTKGAALSFMVAGGITCIPAVVAVKALTRTPVFLTYLLIAMAGSITVGVLYSGYLMVV